MPDLKNLVLSVGSDWDDLKLRIKDKLLDRDLDFFPGFGLLSDYKQKEYIEAIARKFWNNSYLLISGVNWAVGRRPFADIEDSISNDILDSIAEEVLKVKRYEGADGYTVECMSSLDYAQKQEMKGRVKEWLRRRELTDSVPDAIDYDDDLHAVFSDLEALFLRKESESLFDSMEMFTTGIDIVDAIFQGKLDDVDNIEKDASRIELLLGLPSGSAEEFKVAYKMFVEDFQEAFKDTPSFHLIEKAFTEVGSVKSIALLLHDIGGGDKEEISAIISNSFIKYYMVQGENREELKEELRRNLHHIVKEAGRNAELKLIQKRSVQEALGLISERYYPGASKIDFDSFPPDKQEVLLDELYREFAVAKEVDGYNDLDESSQKRFLAEYSYYILENPGISVADKSEKLRNCLLGAKFETMKNKIASLPDMEIRRKSDLKYYMRALPDGIVTAEMKAIYEEHWSEVYKVLFAEGNKLFKGFNLLSNEKKMEIAVMYLGYKARHEQEQEEYKQAIKSLIYKEVEAILREHKIVEKGIEIIPYDMLDLGSGSVVADKPGCMQGFKELTIKHFLDECYHKEAPPGVAEHNFIHSENRVKATLDRTAKRFFTFYLTTEFDNTLYNLIDKLARGETITEADYIQELDAALREVLAGEQDAESSVGLANKILKKAISQLEEKFTAEESKYLKRALAEGASLELLLKRDGESIGEAKTRLMGILSSGFGLEMFREEDSYSLFTSADEILFRDRSRAISYLMAKSKEYTMSTWPKEEIYWLDPEEIEHLQKTYIEEVLCKEPDNFSEWKKSWQRSIQISRQNKEQYFEFFRDKLSAYDMDDAERDMWMEKAKKEILYNIKYKTPVTVSKTIAELTRQKEAARRTEVVRRDPDAVPGMVRTLRDEAERVSFLDRIRVHDVIIERAEEGRKEPSIVSGGVERSTTGIIQKSAKKATVTMALEHYYDVLFQLALGLIEIKRGGTEGLDASIADLLSVLMVSEDEIAEIYSNQSAYENKRRLYVNFQPENILDENVTDSAKQISIKEKIRELIDKNESDGHRVSGSLTKQQRREIKKDIKLREKELTSLHLELNYENQRRFFAGVRDDFNKNVLGPASKSVSNRHVLAFLSSVSQAFSATATIDFVGSAVGIYERLQPGYSERYEAEGRKVEKGLVGNVIDAVLEEEVPKMIHQLYEEQAEPYLRQVQTTVDSLQSLKPEELDLGVREDDDFMQGGAYEIVYEGIFSLLKSVVSGDARYDANAVSNLAARANKSYVTQTSESCKELLKGLRKIEMANRSNPALDTEELSRLIRILEQCVASIHDLQAAMNSDHDGASYGPIDEEEQLRLNMRNLTRQVEIADRIINCTDDLRKVAGASKNIDLNGVLSVYTAVTDDLTDFKQKINLTEALYRELYQRKAGAPVIALKDEPAVEPRAGMVSRYINIAAIKETTLLGITSAVSDASAKSKIATHKRVLEHYVKGMSAGGSKLEFSASNHRYKLSPLRTKRKHGFLRGLFTFIQKVSYFFKYGRIPSTKEIRGNQAKKLTSLFHNEYQKKQLKSKTNILINSARLLSSFNDGPGEPTQRYVRTVIDRYSKEPKLYGRSIIDEHGEILAKYFPDATRGAISDKSTIEDRIRQQQELEEELKQKSPEQYALYVEEANKKILKKYSTDDKFAEEFSSLEFEALKKHFYEYTGTRVSLKENEELLETLRRLKAEKQQLTDEFRLGRRRPGGAIKRYKYDAMQQELESKMSVICGEMANNSMVEFSSSMENAFNRDIFSVESARLKDTRVLHDQRQVGLVAVKQLFEYDLTNDITNSALRAGDKALSSSDGSISVGSEIGAVVNSYAEGSNTDDFKVWAQDITGGMIESGLKQPLTYVQALSDKYETVPPQVHRQSAVPTMERVAREYRARLNAADARARGVGAELRELDGHTESRMTAFARKLQEIVVSMETTVDSVISRLERGLSDPAAMKQGSFKKLFSTMQNSFADQTMLIADAVDKIFTNFNPNRWLEERKDIADKIQSLNAELKGLKSARDQLAKLWVDHKHEMSEVEEKELLERIDKMDHLRSKISSDISKQVQELCYSAPENVDTRILESLCLVRWADCYVDFYRVVLEQAEVSIEELCLKRQAISAATPGSLPEGLLQVYNAGRDSVISELGKVVASGMNAEPLHQLAGYMVRLDGPDRELGVDASLAIIGPSPDPSPPATSRIDIR